ncbi:UNVERIFIED_CONTAM: hypothetical protein LK11_43165 [Mumia flava]
MVVDAANVVGSRPDGWWRDRAGATERLAARLDVLARGAGFPITLVVEGRARTMDPSVAPSIAVSAAAGIGDDAIVSLVAAAADPGGVLVTTSDRGLADRVRAHGASVRGARWLLDRLDEAEGVAR